MFFKRYSKDVAKTYTTAGTYTFTPTITDNYLIELVGGGAGSGAFDAKYYGGWSNWTMACGGSGAHFKGLVTLRSGVTYTLNVGTGGSAVRGNGTSGSGDDTFIQSEGEILVSAGGGTGAQCAAYLGASYTGQGGIIVTSDSVVSSIIANNGNVGPYGTGNGQALSVYDGTGTGYGAGGAAYADGDDTASANAGYAGYAAITYAKWNYDSYGIYKNGNIYVPISNVRKYYKYKYRDWIQPTLTDNGTMGGSSFAVSASSEFDTARKAYAAFDGVIINNTTSGCWHSAAGFPSWIQFYNPNPLKVSKLTVYNRSGDQAFINSYGVSYSDDGVTFIEFLTGTSPSQSDGTSWDINIDAGDHKYWRLTSKSASGNNNGYTAIGEIKITAEEKYTSVGGRNNYDFYETIERYY